MRGSAFGDFLCGGHQEGVDADRAALHDLGRHDEVRDLAAGAGADVTLLADVAVLAVVAGQFVGCHWIVDADVVETIKGPIGHDISAETPEEIGISIVAELIQKKRG